MLRAAILVAFVAGASTLIYQFGFNKKNTEIAQAEPTKTNDNKIIDTAKVSSNTTGTVTSTVSEPTSANSKTKSVTRELTVPNTEKDIDPGGDAKNGIVGETIVVTDKKSIDDVVSNKPIQPAPSVAPAAPVKVADEKADTYKVTEKRELARKEANNKLKKNSPGTDKDGVKDQSIQQENNRAATASRQAEDQKSRNQNQATNIFRGRVTDGENNGIPFANVTNIQDNTAGTYTDANGYFNLTYPDSVLGVQVKSIGFENNNVQLRNAVSNNLVILQGDKRSLSEVVVTKQKPNVTTTNRDVNVKSEEPEPADGWDNYGTYLSNNLEVPVDLKTKEAGSSEVLVSFDVNKNGTPINIKIEKSLCSTCDKEAIRLVKEGPKWKRSATKKGRAKITIAF
jgi:hypothetical protein